MIIIEDYTDAGSDTEPFTIHIDDSGNYEPIYLPLKKQCKRRKYKSYFGQSYESYEAENA